MSEIHGQHLEKLLKGLIARGQECEWVEFKENNSNPELIGEYLSALSNSAFLHNETFGYLVYGVEDKGLQIVGTKFNFKNEKIGNEPLENWLAYQLEPKVDFTAFQFEIDGKNVVLIQVDATRLRPISFKGVEFIRVGSVKKKLKDHPEKEAKIWEKASRTSFENRIAKSGITDDEVLALLDYPKYFELTGTPLPQGKDGIIARFTSEGLILKNKIEGHDITNLGAILFAKGLDKFPHLERKAMRAVIYKGKSRIETIKEHLSLSGYAAGFESFVAYINDQLPSNEVIGKALRKTVKMYPELAIRELVANMLIHQDFDISGTGAMVEIFEDRIEISNPGSPLVETLRLLDHSPVSRNEKLAYFLRRINVCEERGTGIDKVIKSVEEYQLPAPRFVQEQQFFKAVLYAPTELKNMNRDDKNRACYQHCCLKYVSNQVMTNESLRERFQIKESNYPQASRIIAEAIEAGMIKLSDPQSKSKKLASYIPFWA